MSPAFVPVPPASIDLQLLHDNNIDNSKQSATPADGGLLSPYSVYQPYNNSDSPSSFPSPADLTSNGDYSDFTDFNNPDQYFGVDFDAGEDVVEADSSALHNIALPTTELPVEAYLPHLRSGATLSAEISANTAFPMSPNHFTPTNTSHHSNQSYDTQPAAQPFFGGQSQDTSATFSDPHQPNNLNPLSLTRSDHLGFEESVTQSMAHLSHNPGFTVTTSGSQVQQEFSSGHQQELLGEPFSPNYQDLHYKSSPDHRMMDASHEETSNAQQSVYGQHDDQQHPLDLGHVSGRSGLDPDSRKPIANEEITSLKEQKENDEFEATKLMIEEWRSRKSDSSDSEEGPGQPEQAHLTSHAPTSTRYGPSTGAVPLRDPHMVHPRTSTKDPEEGKGILPVSDNDSVHENRLQEGQTYYNLKDESITDADREIAMQSRHWSDAPMYPYAVATQYQSHTSKDAMKRWNDMADNYSLASRTATWGTRRRSEPTAADMESITDGSLFQRIAVTNDKEKRPGPGSYFKDSFEHLSSMVRKKSDSSKLKRNRSERENHNRGRLDAPRKESQTSLAPPPISPSNRRPASPRLDTTVGGPQGHIRSGSVSASNATSPKNTLTSLMGSLRSRSKSDIQGLAKMWGESGGPPVPTLAQQSYLSDPAPEPDFIKLENSDLDAEDDEDEELGDESEKMEFDRSSLPTLPTLAGFQEHVKLLNPKLEAGYLIDRVAHQQVVRYKNLLGWRVNHHTAVSDRTCISGAQCMAQGGTATIFHSNSRTRDSAHSNNGLGLDFSDGDSNPEGALIPESFPSGVPMPPASTLPAEFECQLCFRVKKFLKPSDWTKHVHEDVQPFTCTYASCREPKSFKRKADWVRHENERHRHLEWWACQVDDCTHKCYRKDNFLQHLVREHKLPEPKFKTKAAVKKSRGGPDEQVWAMIQQCHHETTNKPQDEPCKFCGRKLTSWKKLTVHLAKHMEHISLPVMDLVRNRSVDANTIISPVEPLPARQTPLPVTPTDGRRLSSTSAVPFGNISATISPSGHTMGHFISPFDQTPNIQGLPQFPNAGYRDDMAYSQTNLSSGALFTSISQSNHGIVYESTPVGINAFNQVRSNANLTPQSRGYSSMDHSPQIDQNHGFNPINQNYTNPVPQGYRSNSSSHHTHSPDPTSFVSGPQHMFGSGAQAQAVGSDIYYTSESHQIPGYTTHQNQMIGMTDAQYQNYQHMNSNLGYGQMLDSGNQGAYEQKRGRGQSQTYPPSSHGGYGGNGQQ